MAARLRTAALLSLIVASLAFAGGRAGFRFAYPLDVRAWAEEVVWSVQIGDVAVEYAVGLEYADPLYLTPYTAVYAIRNNAWLGLQLGRGIDGLAATGEFRVTLLGGVTW